MSVLAARMREGAAGVPSTSFNPLTSITWKMAAWASDPLWSNPGDGNAVASWRDGSGNSKDLTQSDNAKKPTFNSSVAAFNNQAAVNFDETSDTMCSPQFTVATAPWTFVLIGLTERVGAPIADRWFVTGDNGSDGYTAGFGIYQTHWTMTQGTRCDSAATWDNSTHLFRMLGNSGSSVLAVDETAVISGATTGTRHPAYVLLNDYMWTAPDGTGNYINATVAFVGLYQGDITANGSWAAFKTWAGTTYGLTIA